MTFVYHATTAARVNRYGDVIQAECSLLDNRNETFAWIAADVFSLKVLQAGWALYRSDNRKTGIFDLPDLIGVEAYLNSGPALKNVLGGPGQEMERELISECFRSILQAETFFYRERGFDSAQKYITYWDHIYAGLCRYYNRSTENDTEWPAWLANAQRGYNLFNRNKSITIQALQDQLIVTCSFIDSFHHLHLEIRLDPGGKIAGVRGNFLDAPGDICYENTEHLHKLVGCHLPSLGKKEIAAMVAGPDGCTHLLEMISDAVQATAGFLQDQHND
ncbi:MAG TPA: DUF2889 domain-containing protein [Syntrophomonas sp.]|nr:DUF2889 domain-containing protein [Syntrophomonas sp.]